MNRGVKRKPEAFLLRVEKGALVPADHATVLRLREKGYRPGDELEAELRKARNPKFHRLAHAFGRVVADNLDEFEGIPAHNVLKRLQLEAGLACDEMLIKVPGVGACVHRIPRSLSFASMDETEFSEFYTALCRHVAKHYWPGLTEDQVEQMALMMPEAA